MIDTVNDYGIYVNDTQIIEVIINGGERAFTTLGIEAAVKVLLEAQA